MRSLLVVGLLVLRLLRSGYVEHVSRQQYLESLPRKRSGAGALIFDEAGRLLVVKPGYRHGWLVPGGVVECGESPKHACEREVEEETGLRLRMVRLLCVDYWGGDGERSESLQFLFHGGRLSREQVESIRLCEDELTEYRFLSLSEAIPLLVDRLRERVSHCLAGPRSNGAVYLENGVLV